MEIIRLKEIGTATAVKKAVQVLKRGGIVLYPTDTLYGLGVDAHNAEAVARLKELKGRETRKPISIIVPDIKQMEKCGTMNEAALALAKKYLPGPLTLVIPAHHSMPADVMLNGAIGVRIPKDEFCQAFAHAFNGPITTTSANLAGAGTPTSLEDLIWHFGPKVASIALIIDGGMLPNASASTVVSCVGDTPYILREGAISKTELGL